MSEDKDWQRFVKNGLTFTKKIDPDYKRTIISHFIRRAKQRFRVRLEEEDYHKIDQRIKRRDCFIEKSDGRNIVALLIYKNKTIRCFLNKELDCLITAIPIKRDSLENILGKIMSKISLTEDIFLAHPLEVRTSKRLNYVKLFKINKVSKKKWRHDEIFTTGYPETKKRLDEFLIFLGRKIQKVRA